MYDNICSFHLFVHFLGSVVLSKKHLMSHPWQLLEKLDTSLFLLSPLRDNPAVFTSVRPMNWLPRRISYFRKTLTQGLESEFQRSPPVNQPKGKALNQILPKTSCTLLHSIIPGLLASQMVSHSPSLIPKFKTLLVPLISPLELLCSLSLVKWRLLLHLPKRKEKFPFSIKKKRSSSNGGGDWWDYGLCNLSA